MLLTFNCRSVYHNVVSCLPKFQLKTSTDKSCFSCHSAGVPQRETILRVTAVMPMTAIDRMEKGTGVTLVTQLLKKQVARPLQTNASSSHAILEIIIRSSAGCK